MFLKFKIIAKTTFTTQPNFLFQTFLSDDVKV